MCSHVSLIPATFISGNSPGRMLHCNDSFVAIIFHLFPRIVSRYILVKFKKVAKSPNSQVPVITHASSNPIASQIA